MFCRVRPIRIREAWISGFGPIQNPLGGRPRPRFNLRLAGLDENVGRFASYRDDHLLVKPWPHFGIVGDEGIYGYFGSASRSRAVPVIVRP